MPEHLAHHVVRREQVASESQLAITSRVLDEFLHRSTRRLRAANRSMHAVHSRKPPTKLDDEPTQLSRRVTLFQHRPRDRVLQPRLLETQLAKQRVELCEIVGLKLKDLVLGHENRQ